MLGYRGVVCVSSFEPQVTSVTLRLTPQDYLGQSPLGVQQVCLALVPSLEISLSVDTTNARAKGLAVQLIHLVVKMLPGEVT